MEKKVELKDLVGYSKLILDKKILKKIKKVKDKEEKKDLLIHLIKKELEMIHYDIVRKVRKLEIKGKDIFSIEVKSSLLQTKINYFVINFNKKDFKNLILLIIDIKKEMKNV
ncbi:hypothetical protein GOV12_06555 [Candidatus Pacearchaeota archaeon]|nr:hypothetical protein [Candidatus Pacearchaeota archaeon]